MTVQEVQEVESSNTTRLFNNQNQLLIAMALSNDVTKNKDESV